jgi:hypothetical protein
MLRYNTAFYAGQPITIQQRTMTGVVCSPNKFSIFLSHLAHDEMLKKYCNFNAKDDTIGSFQFHFPEWVLHVHVPMLRGTHYKLHKLPFQDALALEKNSFSTF